MKLSCEEIYYASNQKSALTGNDGFGVRTFTAGMDTGLVSSIASKCLPGYQVNPERQLGLEDIEADPRVVYKYPPAYTFSSFRGDDGSTRWIASRTVYIASDYGFFLDGSVYSRVGSNYYTHALVMDSLPVPSLFAVMTREGFFVPRDYSMRRDNAELSALLTGDAALLPPRVVDLPDTVSPVDPAFVNIVAGLMQAAVNRMTDKPDELKKIIIKAPAADIDKVMGAFAAMPASMMADMRFITNFMKGYGVPADHDIIVVNEYNYLPLYENNYVTVDLIGGTMKNVEPNPFITHAVEAYAAGNTARGREIVEFFLKIDHKSAPDYRFLYNLFLAVNTDDQIAVTEITRQFLTRVAGVSLSAADRSVIDRKMNEAVNHALIYSESPSEINGAINAVAAMRELVPGTLALTAAARTRVTKLVMGVHSYAANLVTPATIDMILAIIARGDVACDEDFYNALQQLDDPSLWERLLNFYYGDTYRNHADAIISAILNSRMNPVTREQLIGRLFPVSANAPLLVEYMKTYPGRIPSLPVTLAAVAGASRQEIFSHLISASMDDAAVITALKPLIAKIFQGKMDQDALRGAKETLNFIGGLTPLALGRLGILHDLFSPLFHEAINRPGPQVRVVLEAMMSFPTIFNDRDMSMLKGFIALYNGEVPQRVGLALFTTAVHMHVSDAYFTSIYDRWLDCGGTNDELMSIAFSTDSYPLSNGWIRQLVWVTWGKFIQHPAERDNRVSDIMNRLNWPDEERKKFAAECPDKELSKFILDSCKMSAKIARTFRNLFKKS